MPICQILYFLLRNQQIFVSKRSAIFPSAPTPHRQRLTCQPSHLPSSQHILWLCDTRPGFFLSSGTPPPPKGGRSKRPPPSPGRLKKVTCTRPPIPHIGSRASAPRQVVDVVATGPSPCPRPPPHRVTNRCLGTLSVPSPAQVPHL